MEIAIKQKPKGDFETYPKCTGIPYAYINAVAELKREPKGDYTRETTRTPVAFEQTLILAELEHFYIT